MASEWSNRLLQMCTVGNGSFNEEDDILSQPQHSDSEVEDEDETDGDIVHSNEHEDGYLQHRHGQQQLHQHAMEVQVKTKAKDNEEGGAMEEEEGMEKVKDCASGEVGDDHAQGSDGPKSYSHLVVFTARKAGMEDDAKVGQDEANAKIFEASKNSSFFINAKRRDEKLDQRIAKLKQRLRHSSSRPVSSPFMARLISRFEAERRLDRVWVVVDMDCFYAAVAMRDNPSLKGKPIAIGGMGMISTANYEARKYRVRSAMPGFIAKQLCPHLIFVKSDWPAYKLAAKQTREIFRDYDPHFTAGSLDEASLDITDYLKRRAGHGTLSIVNLADSVVAEIRERCRIATGGLTCSAGIGPNRMLAKIASDQNKPDGQCNIGFSVSSVTSFMRDLDVRRLPGVGKVTERMLLKILNVRTCGELYLARNRVATPGLFSERTRDWLLKAALGIAPCVRNDPTGALTVGPRRKGISKETTFHSVSKFADLIAICRKIAKGLAQDMQKESLKARTVTLKVKTVDFEVITRAKSLRAGMYIYRGEEIFSVAKQLLSGLTGSIRGRAASGRKERHTTLTRALGIVHPIVQGGMHYVGYAPLAAAVSEAGGIGLVTVLTQPSPEALEKELKKVKQLTSKPFGVNLTLLPMLKPPNYDDFAAVVEDEMKSGQLRVIETAGHFLGLEPFITRFKAAGGYVIHKCTQIRHAKSAERLGVDCISMDGFECAGHPGEKDVTNWILFPKAAEELSIPFIASGGCANGKHLAAALALGAVGMNMGTRFMATQEAPIHPNIKKALVDGDEHSTMLVMRSLKNTERVYKNKLAEEVLEIEERYPNDFSKIQHLVKGSNYKEAFHETGNPEGGVWSAGMVMGLIDGIPTCQDLLHEIADEAEDVIRNRLESALL
eukprot:g3761.t1